ncbi:MAG: hypothetical protein ARM1_0312 [Candidatus Micrarchaeota archaeon]|nr:MAG: hypothetical protein ARM1_0312 [Candidatus Micrarchaeota archaeon]
MGERIGHEKIEREEGYLYYVGKDGYVWKAPTKANRSGKKERVSKEKIEKEKGYLYYIDKNGYVARAKMNREGRKASKKR